MSFADVTEGGRRWATFSPVTLLLCVLLAENVTSNFPPNPTKNKNNRAAALPKPPGTLQPDVGIGTLMGSTLFAMLRESKAKIHVFGAHTEKLSYIQEPQLEECWRSVQSAEGASEHLGTPTIA